MRILNDPLEIIEAIKWINIAIEYAKKSTCERSKCGSVIVSYDQKLIGNGYNSMPCNVVASCFKDNLHSTFKSDKTCCVHAEQRAITSALILNATRLTSSRLYFIRLDENDNPKLSGQPYCTICSKLALDVGIAQFVLWHPTGITIYDTFEYNQLSFQYQQP